MRVRASRAFFVPSSDYRARNYRVLTVAMAMYHSSPEHVTDTIRGAQEDGAQTAGEEADGRRRRGRPLGSTNRARANRIFDPSAVAMSTRSRLIPLVDPEIPFLAEPLQRQISLQENARNLPPSQPSLWQSPAREGRQRRVNEEGRESVRRPNGAYPRPGSRHSILPTREEYNIESDDERDPYVARAAPLKSHALFSVVKKWDLRFGGAPGEEVEIYITSIEEGRELLVIRDSDLINALPYTFTATALTWYRGRKHTFRTWAQVRTALRARFADPEYQLALHEEILRRIQASDEPVSSYLACMNGLFARTDPSWTDAQCVRIAYNNLLPSYQLVIPFSEHLTMEILEAQAVRRDKAFKRLSQTRAPPPPEESMCPSLAYRSPAPPSQRAAPRSDFSRIRHALRSLQLDEETEEPSDDELTEIINVIKNNFRARRNFRPNTKTETNAPPVTTPSASEPTLPFLEPLAAAIEPAGATTVPRAPLKCWNCDQLGHSHRSCTSERTIFCHSCGKKSVTRNTCTCGNRSGKDAR